jgi:predicted N-acetyltransferase YhbS
MTMTRLEFIAQELKGQTLIKHSVTKQDLINYGVIGKKESETDIRIRDALPRDRTAIRELTLAAYQEYAKPLGEYWEGYKNAMLRTLETIGKDNLGKPAQQLVVEDNDEIVAAILLYPAGVTLVAHDGEQLTTKFPEMRLLSVLPELRGRGLGTLLMRECVERVKASGAKAVMFHTTALMRVERLYQRVGDFVRAPEFDFWMSPEVRLETYRLDLEGK